MLCKVLQKNRVAGHKLLPGTVLELPVWMVKALGAGWREYIEPLDGVPDELLPPKPKSKLPTGRQTNDEPPAVTKVVKKWTFEKTSEGE